MALRQSLLSCLATLSTHCSSMSATGGGAVLWQGGVWSAQSTLIDVISRHRCHVLCYSRTELNSDSGTYYSRGISSSAVTHCAVHWDSTQRDTGESKSKDRVKHRGQRERETPGRGEREGAEYGKQRKWSSPGFLLGSGEAPASLKPIVMKARARMLAVCPPTLPFEISNSKSLDFSDAQKACWTRTCSFLLL